MLEINRLIFNQAIYFKITTFPIAQTYDWRKDRINYVKNHKPKTVNTRVGKLRSKITPVGERNFYSHALEKGKSSERAWLLAMAEM